MTVLLNVPDVWPFPGYHIVPANLMPSGRAYVATNGQIVAQSQDIALLVYGYGFSVDYNSAGTLAGTETVTVNGNRKTTTQDIADLGGILVATAPLTSFQLHHLLSDPPIIVPTPGPNKVIVPLAVTFNYVFGTQPYSGIDAPTLNYGSRSGPVSDQWLDQPLFHSENGIYIGGGSNATPLGGWVPGSGAAGTAGPIASYADKPLVFCDDAEDSSSGDGTVTITVRYFILTL